MRPQFLNACVITCLLIATTVNAEQFRKWNVEIGAPGNEFSEVSDETEGSQAPESILRYAKIISPDSEIVSSGIYSSGTYQLVFENERELFWSLISEQGGLVLMYHTDKRERLGEGPGDIVPKGKKVEIEVEQLPLPMVETLAELLPDAKPSKAWYADTLVGPRYLAQVGASVFYATPAGHIRCGAMVAYGGLTEVAADATLGPVLPAGARKALDPHRERFNVMDQIEALKESGGDAADGFRFIVMGDSRSQKDLWEAIVAHIDTLDPKPDFVINSGDVVVAGGAEEFADYYVPPLLNTAIPYFIAIGNHDVGQGNRANEFKYLFGEGSLNYSFDRGNCRFVFLDNISTNLAWEEILELADGWLSGTPGGYRKIVSIHMPPANIEKWAYHAMPAADSKSFTDLMARHGVDEVFLGHIHAYSTATLDGVSYTIAGGGGAGLHDRFGPTGNVHHYVICDVTPGGIKQQVVRFFREDDE